MPIIGNTGKTKIMKTNMKKIIRRSLVVLATVAPFSALAAPITGLFNTGVNASALGLGGLALGGSDAHYNISGFSADPVVVSHPAYVANNATSQWIWREGSSGGDETYSFMTTFDLTGLDAATALLNGRWGADNQGFDIKINGTSTGISLLGVILDNFNALHGFSISNHFVSGINTLEFIIQNNGGPGAFRAELSGTADPVSVPEPGSLVLLSLGLLGLTTLRRRA